MEMYKLCSYCGVMSIQIFLISWNNTVHEFMFCFLAWDFLFIKSHSIILRSGDWAGQVSDWIWFWGFEDDSRFCTVDWSIIILKKIPPWGKCWAITGQRLSSKMFWYLIALIFQLTAITAPGPNQEMHPIS